jgi:hypothetical protein
MVVVCMSERVHAWGCQEIRVSGDQGVRRSGCQEVRVSGGQGVRRSGCQEIRVSGDQEAEQSRGEGQRRSIWAVWAPMCYCHCCWGERYIRRRGGPCELPLFKSSEQWPPIEQQVIQPVGIFDLPLDCLSCHARSCCHMSKLAQSLPLPLMYTPVVHHSQYL